MGSIQDILAEMDNVLNKVEEQNVAELAEKLAAGKRIFTAGEGRSGLMAKSFAMRLMHLGGEVFALGETITPSLKEGDILVAVSGSGTTKQTVWTAEKAREIGVKVIAVTTNPDSPLGKNADSHLVIPAATKFRREGESGSVQPLGSLFDQCAHILFDAICLEYGKAKKVSHEAAFSKHSNME